MTSKRPISFVKEYFLTSATKKQFVSFNINLSKRQKASALDAIGHLLCRNQLNHTLKAL